ncbi:MAG: hypothetical protein JST92_02235 [Deltaproteobacteria bacterium]|nr:hypothetical protein [Deltaproteobacteria bacterium]
MPAPLSRPPLRALIASGLTLAVLDGLFASTFFALMNGRTPNPKRLFQAIASSLLGPDSFEEGFASMALGVCLHVSVAFAWSAIFFIALRQSERLRALLGSLAAAIAFALVYGACIWPFMNNAFMLLTRSTPMPWGTNYVYMWLAHAIMIGPLIVLIQRAMTKRAEG